MYPKMAFQKLGLHAISMFLSGTQSAPERLARGSEFARTNTTSEAAKAIEHCRGLEI